jgi:hypothetical protein
MTDMRDEFNEKAKRIVAQRVGFRCSKPSCRASTSGPQLDPAKTLNLGVAAHITAASGGGPRYDPSLSPEERKHINNAIWLCQNCGKLVDNDQSRFTAEKLRQWKVQAEAGALAIIGRATVSPSSPSTSFLEVYADENSPLRIKAFAYEGNANYPAGTVIAGIPWNNNYVDVRVGMYNGSGITIRDLDLFIQLDTHIASIGQITNVPDLFISPFSTTPSVWLEGSDDNNQDVAVPVLPVGPITSPIYRLYCPRLLSKSEVSLVIASLALNPAKDGFLPQQLFAPRRLPKVINFQGAYIGSNDDSPVRYHVLEEELLDSNKG